MVTRRSSVSQPTPAAPALPAGSATKAIPQPGSTPVEGAADINDAYGTKTLAELREEARRQRKDALIAVMPARAALLAEIWYLMQGCNTPQVFGAGLDPAAPLTDPAQGLVRDPNTDQELAAFRDKWMEDPRLGAEYKPKLFNIPPSPPAVLVRRDSTLGDMSDEVAAVEKELIRPEYRRSAELRRDASTSQLDGDSSGKAGQAEGESSAMDLDESSEPSKASATDHKRQRTTSSSLNTQPPPRHRRQSSAISPFPVTFRSPAFKSDSQAQAPSTTLSDHPLQQPLTIDPSQLTLNPPLPPVEQTDARTSNNVEIRTDPLPSPTTSYAPVLPPLPDALVRNRLAVGGLAQKKAKDRHAQLQHQQQQQQQQLAQSTSGATPAPAQPATQPAPAGPTTADLYKLGVSQATHSGVRSLVGAGAPAAGKTRTGGKALMTQDWSIAISEFQTLKALERVETLKADKSWSFRQLRKQRAPAIYKSHWDYMLEEMKWLATDVKQETRWKAATAYQIALEVRQWHEADAEGKKNMQIKVGQPKYIQEQEQLANDSVETQVVLDTPNASFVNDSTSGTAQDGTQTEPASSQEANPPPPAAGVRSEKVAPLALENNVDPIPATAVNAQAAIQSLTDLPSVAPEVPRDRKYLREMFLAREPIFNIPLTQTVYELPVSSTSKQEDSNVKLLPHVYEDVSNFDTFNEALQGLPLYAAPPEPSSDNRQNRRIDEASQHHSRIVNVSHLLESKPLLISTLTPAKKRKRSGDWSDMMDLIGEDGKESLVDLYKTNVTDVAFAPAMTRPKDTIGKRGPPPQPPNAEARSLTMDWSPEEDAQLSIYARQYAFNWDLIAHVFNSATRRGSVKMDVRLAWDCYDRYNKKFAQGPANALAIAQPSPAISLQGGVPLPGSQASPAANGPIPLSKSTRRASEAAGQLPSPALLQTSISSAVTPGQGTPTAKKPEVSKAHRRHELMVEATRKSQMRRAQQQKNNLPPAVRKVNLTSHETHNVPYYPNISALDLSKMKAERERAQLEEIRKREQAKMYQQAQAAAMAQQQQIQQLQAQGQPIPPQLQRSAMQLPPNVRIAPNGPQGAAGVPAAQLQAVLMQAQRAGHVLPAHLQMAQRQQQQQQQQQQGQVSLANQANLQRPPSQQGGQPGNMVVTPGGTQQPIPLPPMPASQLQSSPPHQSGYPPGMHLAPQGRTGSPQNPMTALNASQSPQPSHMQMSPHQMQMQLQQGQMPQLTQAQQQAFLAQLAAQGRSGSPNMGMVGLPGGFPVQNSQPQQQQPQLPPMTPEQQQQLLAMMRMRQSSQGSQASVQ